MAQKTLRPAFRLARRAARRPGRPGGAGHSEAVRAALLAAARDYFARHDFQAASVRQIAAAARVNPAMIHYHFGDKAGLYRAMLQETLGSLLARVQALTESERETTAVSLGEMIGAIMRTLAREPWIARLIVREVLAEEGAFRETFIREFAARGGGRFPALIRRGIERGELRRDLDPVLAALALMSLIIFPFVALPVAEKVFGIRMTDGFVRRLIEHTARLFHEGVAVGRPVPARARQG